MDGRLPEIGGTAVSVQFPTRSVPTPVLGLDWVCICGETLRSVEVFSFPTFSTVTGLERGLYTEFSFCDPSVGPSFLLGFLVSNSLLLFT